ncbi:MAG: PQQ-binding-like beta-propeller repeat protein, partial [Lentisphaeria bacterium]|nr:PQQ-binding-like beta-propeller repeat protein [Lentisphaeria bacterium]
NDGYVYCLSAKTGEQIWRFHAAPEDRLIPVYDRLMSTWPVAGGVALHEGVVYAAAGIAHYDGTHVYALDALTGKLIWHNDTSGSIGELENGVSLQGKLGIKNGSLQFCGGNAYPEAIYNLKTGVFKWAASKWGKKGTTFYAVPPGLRYAVREIKKRIEKVFFTRRPVVRVHGPEQEVSFPMENNSRFTLDYKLQWSGADKPFADFSLKPAEEKQVKFTIPKVDADAFPRILWSVEQAEKKLVSGTVTLPITRQAKWDADSKAHFKINRKSQVLFAVDKWEGPEDCSADVKVEKTDKGLTVTVDVTDNVINRGNGIGRGVDGVALYLDLRTEKQKHRFHRGYRKGVVMISAVPAAEKGKVAIKAGFSKKYAWAAIPGISVTSEHKEKGYVIVFFIPWEGLKKNNFFPTEELRFDVGINDLDKGRKFRQLMWSGDRENWRNPFVFGHLVD